MKIRGYRVELGEIEAALACHPGVEEAAVVVGGPAERRELRAFYVGTPGLASELSARLRRTLPPYMWPKLIRHTPSLPLTANGKVDRAALADDASGERRSREAVSGVPDVRGMDAARLMP